jgi:hypothetical protein
LKAIIFKWFLNGFKCEQDCSVAKQQHFYAAPAEAKNFDAVPSLTRQKANQNLETTKTLELPLIYWNLHTRKVEIYLIT